MTRNRTAYFLFASICIGLLTLLGSFLFWDQFQESDDSSVQQEKKMQVRLFVPAPINMALPSLESDFIRQAIESKFDVSLDLSYMLRGNEYNAKIEALLIANNPPDMWIDWSNDGASKLALQGVLADMTPYISPVSMPNYFKYWVSESELKQYHIHNRFYRVPIPYDKNNYRSYYIREDWLAHLGMEIPRNYEEYVQVLRAFTFKDPDGNSLSDTFGFTTSGNSLSLSTDWPEFAKNGLVYPAYMDNNNQFVDMESDLRIGHVVDDILQIIDEGLIDPDWFFNQDSEHIEKAIQGKAGIVLGETADFALDANPSSIQTLSRKINPQANWVPFNPLGNEPLSVGASPEYPFVFSKMVADGEPEKIRKMVAILDWLAGEEGYLLTHYGIEGEHYERSGNTITLLPQSAEKAAHYDLMKLWSFFTPETPSVLGLQVINPALTPRDKEIKTFLAGLPTKAKLGIALTPPIGIDVSAFRARQNELQVKMLFSDRSGKMWSQYYNEIMSQYNGFQIIKNFEDQVKTAYRDSLRN